MNFEEFHIQCAVKNSEDSNKIEDIRKKYELEFLYLIYISAKEVVWGMRGADVDSAKLVADLRSFVLDRTGFDFDTEMSSISVLTDPVEEVELLIDRMIINYVESHGGSISLSSVNENTGEVFISMGGSCDGCSSLPATLKDGVEELLKSIIPWVKKAELAKGRDDVSFAQAEEKSPVIVTESAARKIKSLVEEKNFSIAGGLRVSVVPGGCSGFQYKYAVEEKPGKDDEVIVRQFTDNGNQASGRVFITKLELKFLIGSTLDYGPMKVGFGEAFSIKNPNAKGSCGCGTSDSL